MNQESELIHLTPNEIKLILTNHIKHQGYEVDVIQFVHSDNSENCFLGVNAIVKPKKLETRRIHRQSELYYGC